MKKRTMIVVLVFVLVVAAMCFVACDKGNSSTQSSDPPVTPGEYETASYTVTFNTMGGTTDPNWKTKTYEYGSTIEKPTYTPIKAGYVFKYWASSTSGTAFDFATSYVQNDFTLYAIYQASTIKHTFDLTAVLHNTVDGYAINRGEYTYGSMPSADTVLATQYGNSSSVLAVPYASNAPKVNGNKDYFLFWYYLDEDNQPVRFSTIASDESTSVTVLSAYKGSSLELYPMWLSTAATITVTFKDANAVTTYGEPYVGYCGQSILETEKPVFAKENYEIKSLTFVNKDSTTEEFVFDSTGSSTDATILSEMVDYDYFKNQKVTVNVNWIKKISIASKTNYESYYNLLRTSDPDSDTQEKIDEFLTAKIGFASIDFGGAIYEPLFDSNHIFTGIIDSSNSKANAVFKNATFKANDSISVFGYVDGEIKNIDIESCAFEIGDEPSSSILFGGIATVLNGTIFDCNITMDLSISGVNTISIGGIVAEGSGEIQNCSVTINSCSITAGNVSFGGIATKIKPTSTCLENKAIIVIDSISTTGTLSVGGIAVTNAGTISTCVADISVKESSSYGTVFGGLVANNAAIVRESKAIVDLGVSKSVTVCGAPGFNSSIGGLLGTNSGQLMNSYSSVKLAVAAPVANIQLFVGGLVGYNSSLASTSTAGAINYAYSIGTIDVSVPNLINNNIYAGGLVGKNTQSGISSVFAEVNVNVIQQDGTRKVGYLIGNNTSSASLALTYVSSAAQLTINSEAYELEDNTVITVLSNEVEATSEDLRSSGIIFGTAGTTYLKFDNKVWAIKTEGTLPVLSWEK